MSGTSRLGSSCERLALADVASGYVFLIPSAEREFCDRIPGFISQAMFVRYKPYYEARANRSLKNAEEANRCVPVFR